MMKKTFNYISIALIFIVVLSCESGSTGSDDAAKTEEECGDLKIEQFTTFMGLEYGSTDKEVGTLYGIPTTKNKKEASTKLDYTEVLGAPLTIYYNNNTNEVETILIEALGTGTAFIGDIKRAIREYKIPSCEGKILGLKKEDVLKEMGEPLEQGDAKDYSFLKYESTDKTTVVIFKFYLVQGNQCSSIQVDWFY